MAPRGEPVTQSRNSQQMLEYVLHCVAAAPNQRELDRLGWLARAHYAGRLLEDVEDAIAARPRELVERDSGATDPLA